MSEILFSILMFVLGLGLGIVILVIINNLKIKNSGNKAELIIEKAKKDADKLKRDAILEQNPYNKHAYKLLCQIYREKRHENMLNATIRKYGKTAGDTED